MARNQHAVIWTRVSGQPEKMGDLLLSGDQAAFTYTRDYLSSERPGFCLLGDGRFWGDDSVNYPISERIPVFPRLLSLIPGNNPRNLQRRHYLDLLRKQLGREPPPGVETEWLLLLAGGHGGIGHIDVFANDIVAESWYGRDTAAGSGAAASGNRSQLWHMLKNNVLDEPVAFDPRLIEETLGPTPSVGGMIPKLLVSMTPGDSAPNFYPPDAVGKTNVVLKVEPPEYTGLLDLEALCLDIHRQAGFDTPAYSRYDDDGLHFLAVERFDCIGANPHPMESLFSVIATGDHQFRETGDILLDELGNVIDRLAQVVNLAADTGEQLYLRFLMALLTGNGDLHLDNVALLGGVSDCRLAPVYDPAPMRAWPRHNLVSAIPFDPSGYADHGEFFVSLGGSFGLSGQEIQRCLDKALAATADFPERLMALQRVPERQRLQLRDIVASERALLTGRLG
ncbi:MAG: HipA domain-containing protein [Thiogranum sp.]|jgi:serine/threonine-protein kinase HipA